MFLRYVKFYSEKTPWDKTPSREKIGTTHKYCVCVGRYGELSNRNKMLCSYNWCVLISTTIRKFDRIVGTKNTIRTNIRYVDLAVYKMCAIRFRQLIDLSSTIAMELGSGVIFSLLMKQCNGGECTNYCRLFFPACFNCSANAKVIKFGSSQFHLDLEPSRMIFFEAEARFDHSVFRFMNCIM